MSSPSSTAKRVVRVIGTVAIVAAAVRIWQASNGSVDNLRAASEVGVGLSLVGLAFAVARLWRDARRSGRIFLVATALAGVATVLVPLWHFGHLPTPLYAGTLGGSDRKVEVGPAPESADYDLSVRRPAASVHDDYILEVRVGDEKRTLQSRFGNDADVYSLALARGQTATLSLTVGDAAAVEVALPTLPWEWVRLAALLVVLLACIGEWPVSRSQPNVRGLWTAVIAVSALYLVFLNPLGEPTGRGAVGAGMGAAAAGGALGAFWGAMVRRMRARRTSR